MMPQSVRRWLRLPSRIALILGVGALSATGARADHPADRRDPAVAPEPCGDLVIRSERGKIYLSEAGREFREVALGNTPEARRLKQLLESTGSAAAPGGLRLSPMLLAGGGGAGFHWAPFGKADNPPPETGATPSRPAAPRTGTPQKPTSPTPPRPPEGNGKG